MSDLYWLTDEQMAWLAPYFAKSHSKLPVADAAEDARARFPVSFSHFR